MRLRKCARSRSPWWKAPWWLSYLFIVSRFYQVYSSQVNHSPGCTDPIVYSAFFPFRHCICIFPASTIMCGDTNRPTFGGTIAVLFPRENRLPLNSGSLSSSPDSVVSSTSSTSTLSSYSLFFRDAETTDRKTKGIFQADSEETFESLRGCGHVDMRIE